ncbi:MAG: hypothetical protein QF386_06975 [Alphaproteobacteria bacterium]|mgnify:CR=1 FL=1|jgi:hypothetical protein|nr:hypothetical protein [Rhodospirillaceae bacterium]MDP6486164.1 hypothetical protein [Alphaproteobacteria bacterium]MDP6660854.1 hypothetical protein [Alphaproteobacteria bacterium]MDP6780735.1 hypothetical protein [Alphaproteobacteria bacterium]MDP7045351.1 hypothetical protein [Alphaproteobacteria bacterium]|tara:strand:- start:567 stop:1052 length:486 start_codon:yes stop_codon:yes gene_type:complete
MDVLSTKALIAGLFSWISLHTGYEIPEKAPDVVFVSHEKLVELACHDECPVLGFYHPSRVVYLDMELKPETNLCARSILVHELVHAMQHENGSFHDVDARERSILREKEALLVHRNFLRQNGRGNMFKRNLRLRRTVNGAEVREGAKNWRWPLQAYFGPDC